MGISVSAMCSDGPAPDAPASPATLTGRRAVGDETAAERNVDGPVVDEATVDGSTVPEPAVAQPGTPTWRSRISPTLPLLVPPLLYALASAYNYSRFLAHPTRGAPGGADGVIYSWYFEWIEQSVIHLHNPFISPAMNAPLGVNVMWNTSLFALALVCVPLTALIGAGPTVGLLAVLAPVASATTAYFVLRRLTGRASSSALAAALYGFGPFFVGQNGHLHLIFAVFPPLLLLLGHQLIVRQDKDPRRAGLWLGVATGVQLLISEEIVVLAAIVAAASVVILAATDWRAVAGRVRHAAIGLGVAALTAVVIAGVPLGYQLFGPLALAHGVVPSGQRLDLSGLVRPGVSQYYASASDIAAFKAMPANGVENTGYLGWALIGVTLAMCAALMIRRERFVFWWLGTTLVAVALSLGTPVVANGRTLGAGLWALVRRIPMLDGVVVVRFTLITTLLVALMLAWGLAKLNGRAFAVGLIVVAAALVPLRPAARYYGIVPIKTPRFFTTSAVNVIPRDATVFLMPYGTDPGTVAVPMQWQIRAHLRFRLIGGYSVFSHHGRMTYGPDLPAFARTLRDIGVSGLPPSAAELAAGRASIGPSRVRYVVIADGQWNAALVFRTAAELTGCTPRRSLDVTLCEVR